MMKTGKLAPPPARKEAETSFGAGGHGEKPPPASSETRLEIELNPFLKLEYLPH